MPSAVNLGGTYDPQVVLGVLQHLAMLLVAQAARAPHARHLVKSRLKVTHGFDGCWRRWRRKVARLRRDVDRELDRRECQRRGFGAAVPRSGRLAADRRAGRPAAGGRRHWLIGVIRRLNRELPQQARSASRRCPQRPDSLAAARRRFRRRGPEPDLGVLLDTLCRREPRAQLLLRAGTLVSAEPGVRTGRKDVPAASAAWRRAGRLRSGSVPADGARHGE